MKNFTQKISGLLLAAFIGSMSLGAVSCGPSRGYVEQDFGNGLAGGLYYNGGTPHHGHHGHPAPPPKPPKRHKPKPPKKHKTPKPPKHKHHKDKHHDKHKGHGHRSH
ncbi:MAG: hypothetical protein HDS25_05065 [Bacteroides sp.]|nr:hypothetical protein [Bacteroides sp.]